MAESTETRHHFQMKNVIIIDDAFAPVAIEDINGDDLGLFTDKLRESPEAITEIKTLLGFEDFNPQVAANINQIVECHKMTATLWELADRDREHWLNSTLFSSYRTTLFSPESELQDLLTALRGLECTINKCYTLNESQINFSEIDTIFFDYYLKGETDSENALERAKKLGEAILTAKQNDSLKKYPLVVLMSSRDGASASADAFKRHTKLRGDFFRFIPKTQLSSKVANDMDGLLKHYEQNQKLACLLDEYWLAAQRSATLLRDALTQIEPTELALLEEAELGIEQEKLPDYLSWLISEYLSALVLKDKKVQEVSKNVPEALAHVSFPGHVPPNSALADMYVRSVMRLDINDDDPNTESSKVTLGDVFAKFSSENRVPTKLFLVVDQSCDLARPSEKTKVLCLSCKPIALSDVAQAFYRSSDKDGKADIVPILLTNGSYQYYLASWDTLNPLTLTLKTLNARKGGFFRVARFKPILALARQETLTQKIGRIGENVIPPNAHAYLAKIVFNYKDSSSQSCQVTKSATDEKWASVVIVQGRHLAFNNGNVSNGAHVRNGSTKPTSRISFTEEFSSWLLNALSNIDTTNMQSACKNKLTTFTEKLQEDTFQRADLKVYSSSEEQVAGTLTNCRTVTVTNKIKMTVVFEEIPEVCKHDPFILLLTKYTY